MKAPLDPPSADDRPDVPGFRTWRSIYIFVSLFFIISVVALAIFSRVFA